ncbi:putative phage abortive infection protein [Aeromonas sp. DNP9]|uniref:putative phage abortive infection protein n=1 Tax=Aeromonas sp. DNP9 TaxID=1535548 RepID=UPI00084A95AE|nr:putative phage abortive infection protein [Aeromonas sp. DNP9]OEC42818.1 hypothetical protein A9G06_04535 [Aeromonas sp. DNP9]
MNEPIINNKSQCFFNKLRDKTFYNVFKKALVDNQDPSQSDESLLRSLHLMLVVGIFLLLIAIVVDLVFNIFSISGKLGVFGDFLGGTLNPIFTLMTFFGVIVTIALQKLELRAAREEYKKSANALDTQAIENTFFNMLNLHYKITENLKFDAEVFMEANDLTLPHSKNNSRNGTAAFSLFFDIAKSNWPYDMKRTIGIYKELQNNYNYIFGHYFRNLYQIINFVAKNDNINPTQKKKYLNMLRAHLSSDELFTLFINCTGNMVDNGEFRELLVEYSFLEHMVLEYNSKNESYYSQGVRIANLESITEFKSKDPTKLSAFGNKIIYLP